MSILGVLSKIEKCNKKKKLARHKGRGVGPAEHVHVRVHQWTCTEDYLLQCFAFSCNVSIVGAE